MRVLLVLGIGLFGAVSLLFVLYANWFLAVAMGALAFAHFAAMVNGVRQ